MNFDNGWFRIVGVKRFTVHYFFNDLPIHVLKHGIYVTDCSKRYPSDYNHCKRCTEILRTYSKIGLQNRCN